MAVVVFDCEGFRAVYPELERMTDAALEHCFAVAALILDNSEASPVPYCPEDGIETRKVLFDLLVCHIATLKLRGPAVGALSMASQGSVSSSFSLPSVQGAEWFAQTPCGLSYWQASAAYRAGGRYYGGCFS